MARIAKRGDRALAAPRADDHPPPRPHRAGRADRAGACRVGTPAGGLRSGVLPDGLSQDQRAVLEEGAPCRRRRGRLGGGEREGRQRGPALALTGDGSGRISSGSDGGHRGGRCGKHRLWHPAAPPGGGRSARSDRPHPDLRAVAGPRALLRARDGAVHVVTPRRKPAGASAG